MVKILFQLQMLLNLHVKKFDKYNPKHQAPFNIQLSIYSEQFILIFNPLKDENLHFNKTRKNEE